MNFEIFLEAALGGYQKTSFKGKPAVVLHQDHTYQYVLTPSARMPFAQELKIGDYIGLEEIGVLHAAEVLSKPGQWYAKPTGAMVAAGGGAAPSPEHRLARHGGDVSFRVRYFDTGEKTEVKKHPRAKIPILIKVRKEIGPA